MFSGRAESNTSEITPAHNMQSNTSELTPANNMQSNTSELTPAHNMQSNTSELTPAHNMQSNTSELTPAHNMYDGSDRDCQKFSVSYEGYSKINLRLVGKNKRVVIASKCTLSSNKELLFLLYAYPHTFSLRSVGVNTDRTWTLSSPLSPAVRYVL